GRAGQAEHTARRSRRDRRSHDHDAAPRTARAPGERWSRAATGAGHPRGSDAGNRGDAMTRRARERGSFAPMVAYGTMIVCVMGMGGATTGRITNARKEAQNIADSAALAAADATRVNGIDANRNAALALGRRNTKLPSTATISGVFDQQLELDIATAAGE